MEAKGIKESLELLEGLKVLAVDAKKITADGKVDMADIPAALDILKNFGTLNDAVQGVDQIPAEFSDLSEDEIKELGAKAFELILVIKGA